MQTAPKKGSMQMILAGKEEDAEQAGEGGQSRYYSIVKPGSWYNLKTPRYVAVLSI
jgi:hypothetical protein